MIKNWIVNSSDELDSVSSTRPAEESQKPSSQEPSSQEPSSQGPTNPQVSLLGLDVSVSVCCPERGLTVRQPGPMPPFPLLDGIPPFDLSSLDYSSIFSVPLLPFDTITSLGLTDLETAFGIPPSSIPQPLPHIPQSGFPQMPSNPPAQKVQEDVMPQRSNVLSSILIGPSKCDSVRSLYMNIPRSTPGKRSEREKCQGSKPPRPMSGSGAEGAHHKLLSPYPFLPASIGTNTDEHIPKSLDSFPNVTTGAFPLPPSVTSLGNFTMISPPSDPPLSLCPYIPNEPFCNSEPAKFPGKDGLKTLPGDWDLQMLATQLGDPNTLYTAPALSTTIPGPPPCKTLPDVPLVNIENRSILKQPTSRMPTSTYDTKHPFVYEHRANPVRNHKDAMRIMFGTHPLTYGERDIIECISGEQRKLIIERKVDHDAAGGTRRRR